VAALIDTNVLVYRFDDRFAEKQKVATEILRRGRRRLRPPAIRGYTILKQSDALREAEEFLEQFTVPYPK
jgi:hypothetical protein